MSNEVEVMDAVSVQNYQVAHSVMVMEQWGNGEVYNEATWIERGRLAVRQTMEGMFELGRALIVLKEHTEHGRFMEIVKGQFGIGHNETARLMSATQRFATPQMQKAAPKLMDLGKSKLLELLVEEDVTLVGLAEGEEVNGMTFDDVDRMTVRELRVALRESRENLAAKDEVMKTKTAKIDELTEKLAKKQTVVREPKAEDVGSELAMQLTSLEVGIRSQVSRLKDLTNLMRTVRHTRSAIRQRWSARSIKLFWTASNCAKAMPCRLKHRQTMCRNGWAVKREKAMNPAMIERLKAVENQAEAMERGARSAYLKQQAQELGISLATLYRKLEAVSVKPTRKRRSDAGKTELKPEEAKLISAVLVEAMRRNGKRLMSVRQAVEMLRANGKIEAARIDGETGEVIPSLRTAFRPLARHRPHRPVMAHPRRRHEDQTPLYRPTVGLGGRNTPRAAHTDRRQHPPFPRHPPTAQTRPPSRPHQHQIRPQRHPTTGL